MVQAKTSHADQVTTLKNTVNDEHLIRDYLKNREFLANDLKAFSTVVVTICFHVFALWTYFGLNSPCLFVVTYALVFIRWFMIFHDCTHLSFWENKTWCIYFGKLLSCLVFTPYTYWRTNHILHHENSGDQTSTKYNFNDTIPLTVRQYVLLPSWKRYLYRFGRDPIIFFTIIPFIHFFIMNRFKKGAFITNVSVPLHCYFFYYFGGIRLIMLFVMTMILASSGGFILFHFQHTYNPTYINHIANKYSKFDASLRGSSHIIIPPILKWFTLGIEYHHIHHLTTRIPCYNLEHVHKKAPPYSWDNIFVFDSFHKIIDSLGKTLWDEEQHRFVGFSEISQEFEKIGLIIQ
ncbi:hypothetical protein I4U23_023106 [Adineta vaga]|nr:hypothetical protein I4U23_023106 [Adineta vaga]